MHTDRRSLLRTALGGFAVFVSPTAGLAGGTTKPRRHTWVASWYGKELAGALMYNGQPFDPDDATIAAHKTLPMGTRLELHYPDTGETLKVTVQDRGPHVEGRDIDLSRAAAERLGFVDDGLAVLSVRIMT